MAYSLQPVFSAGLGNSVACAYIGLPYAGRLVKSFSEIDALVKAGLHESRSEAIRDSIRRMIEAERRFISN